MENNNNGISKIKSMTYEFEGIASGDYESFCWDVDDETYTRIKGEKPEEFDESRFNKGLFRIYPDDLYRFNKLKCMVKISIEAIEE